MMMQQNDAVELELEFSNLKFHARGSQSWVDEKLQFFLSDERFTRPKTLGKSHDINDTRRDRPLGGVDDLDTFKLGPLATKWVSKFCLPRETLEHVFHRSDDALEVIASDVPGVSKREKTVNTYRLEGLRAFLRTDDQTFSDEAARDLCRTLGCFDKRHHAEYMNDFGNHISGDKKKGYTLTGPGLKAAAQLIKEIAGVPHDNPQES